MPTVPTLPGPQVAPNALPDARLSPNAPLEAFGGGNAAPQDMLGGFTRGAVAIYEDEKRKADEIAITDADAKLTAAQTQLLYGTQDNPQSGALNRMGKDSFTTPEDVQSSWNKATADIMSGLTNDTQRMVVDRMAKGRFGEMNGQVQQHLATQRDRYDQETTDGLVKQESDLALKNYQQPDLVEGSIARQQEALTAYASRHSGLPDGWLKQRIAQVTSQTYTGVIHQLIDDKNMLAAKSYFADHESDISGSDAGPLRVALKQGSILGAAQQASDSIMSHYTNDAAAYAEAKQIQDPEVREATTQQIQREIARREKSISDAGEQISQQAVNIIQQTHNWQSVPTSIWSQLKVSQRGELVDYAKKLSGGEAVKTDLQTYYDLRTQASTPALQDQFLKLNLPDYINKLSPTDFEEITGIQASLRQNDGKSIAKLDGYRTVDQVVKDGLNGAGINPNPKGGTDQAKNVASFHRQVDEQVAAFEQRTGKKAGADDAQHIVDNLLVQGVVSGSGFFGHFQTTKRVYEAAPGESLTFNIGDIPKTDRQQIESALRRRGVPVNDANVLDLYRRKQAARVLP